MEKKDILLVLNSPNFEEKISSSFEKYKNKLLKSNRRNAFHQLKTAGLDIIPSLVEEYKAILRGESEQSSAVRKMVSDICMDAVYSVLKEVLEAKEIADKPSRIVRLLRKIRRFLSSIGLLPERTKKVAINKAKGDAEV